MKNLSYWAKNNVWKARILITLAQFALAGLALFWAIELNSSGIQLHISVPAILIVLFIGAYLIYPSKRSSRYSYNRQKVFDSILLFLGTLMITAVLNTGISFATKSYAKSNTKESISSVEKDLNKSFKSKSTSQKLKRAKSKTGLKIALIVLTIAIALGLGFFVLVLACGAACSGAGGLSVLIMLIGLTLIIWGLIKAIKGIKKIGKSDSEAD